MSRLPIGSINPAVSPADTAAPTNGTNFGTLRDTVTLVTRTPIHLPACLVAL